MTDILSQVASNMDGEAAQTERTRRIRDALAQTTIDVKAGNILEAVDEEALPVLQQLLKMENKMSGSGEKGGLANEELGKTAEGGEVSKVINFFDLDGLKMDHCLLQLPHSNASAAVGDKESQLPSSSSPPSSCHHQDSRHQTPTALCLEDVPSVFALMKETLFLGRRNRDVYVPFIQIA